MQSLAEYLGTMTLAQSARRGHSMPFFVYALGPWRPDLLFSSLGDGMASVGAGAIPLEGK